MTETSIKSIQAEVIDYDTHFDFIYKKLNELADMAYGKFKPNTSTQPWVNSVGVSLSFQASRQASGRGCFGLVINGLWYVADRKFECYRLMTNGLKGVQINIWFDSFYNDLCTAIRKSIEEVKG